MLPDFSTDFIRFLRTTRERFNARFFFGRNGIITDAKWPLKPIKSPRELYYPMIQFSMKRSIDLI